VQRIQPELDALLAKLGEIDEGAMACARELAEELGASEPNLRGLTQVLEKAEAQQLHNVANRVRIASRNVQEVLQKNRTLIENEMIYVNGTLTLIAKASADRDSQYGGPRKAVVQRPIAVDTAA
jgi:hypothetical protein